MAGALGSDMPAETADAVLIGLLRHRHGCPGPNWRGLCHWYRLQVPRPLLHDEDGPPLLGRRARGDRPGEYL